MTTNLASVFIALVAAGGTAIGALAAAWRSKRRDTVDIAARWQETYRDLLAQFATLRSQLEMESEARLALEGRLARATRRIAELERALSDAGVPFSGPPV